MLQEMEVYSGDNGRLNATTVIKGYRPSSGDMFVVAVYTTIKVLSVTLLAIGYVCNPISVAVLSRKTFRGSAMSVYLRFVAICDSVALTTGLVSTFRLSLFGREILKDLNVCRVYYWTNNVSGDCSSWTLIAVTVERVISIAWPHKVKMLCSVTASKVTVLLMPLTWGTLLVFVPLMLGHTNSTDPLTNLTYTRICVLIYHNPVTYFLKDFFDVIVYAIIPSSVLIICNVLILSSVIQSRQRILKISASQQNHTSGIPGMCPTQGFVKIAKNKHAKMFRSNKETSLTLTLVCINTSYIVFNLPVVVFQKNRSIYAQENLTPHDYAIFMLLYLVMYFNNICNFLLYFLTGSRFQQELKTMCHEIVYCLTFKRF